MRPPTPVHYLRRNEAEWSPPNVAFFDTETAAVELDRAELHTLRLWCGLGVRRDPTKTQRPDAIGQGTTTEELATWVERQLIGTQSLWLWAHNLGFDLTASRLVTVLIRRGWRLTDFSVDDRSPWFRLARGSKRVTMVDSWSWLPTALATIGEAVSVPKPALPDQADDDAAWFHRCRGDVDTLAAAVLSLLDWWDRTRLGRFTITGAACGWNAMRHRMVERAVLIEPTADAQRLERQAVRGGRRDVWRWGTLTGGPFVQLDIERAHPTIAEHLALPRRRVGAFDTLAPDDPIWRAPFAGAIAEATVTVQEPRYPVRWQGQQWWPTGTFQTVLAWPELQMARQRGELVEVGRGYRYQLAKHMADWGRWVNAAAAGRLPDVPPVGQLAAKHWGRSVIGKWAGRSSTMTKAGLALNPGWHVEDGYDMGAKARAAMVDICGSRWWVVYDQEPDNAFPAVLAWVESELRVRMAAVVESLGTDCVVSCDTDGLILDLGALDRSRWAQQHGAVTKGSPWVGAAAVCEQLAPLVAPLTIRAKALLKTVRVTGPQQLTLDGTRRFSGIPTNAQPNDRGGYTARLWPRLKWQMSHGDRRGYLRPEIDYRAAGRHIAKWCLANGTLFPVQARVGAYGETELVPWAQLTPRPPFDLAADGQHPLLAGLGTLA